MLLYHHTSLHSSFPTFPTLQVKLNFQLLCLAHQESRAWQILNCIWCHRTLIGNQLLDLFAESTWELRGVWLEYRFVRTWRLSLAVAAVVIAANKLLFYSSLYPPQWVESQRWPKSMFLVAIGVSKFTERSGRYLIALHAALHAARSVGHACMHASRQSGRLIFPLSFWQVSASSLSVNR